MSLELRKRLFDQLDELVIIDPHTHIDALDPAAHTLADILGYHYYTELAHSAGMPKNRIEEPDLDPMEKVERLVAQLAPLENTIQYSWLVEMCQRLFGFRDDRLTLDNWDDLYDASIAKMTQEDWPAQVLKQSKLEAVFLTNEFDDPLEGFDTATYIPCLRTDDLVFHLAKEEVRERLQRASGVTLSNADSVREAIGKLFDHFTARGARACAISLPPDFTPTKISDGRMNSALDAIATVGTNCGEPHKRAIANFVFWTLAEFCADYSLPFDLMIGVNRGVYESGVHQGRDLYDSRVSLIQYKDLFNAFPLVKFPVSVLASVTNQELASYAWIFPNVVTNGHWWYSNTPAYIEQDLAARLEAVPQTKQIGYYSDMYKLEFALPKFAMYKRILAKVLAERFVIDRNWTEERAFELGKQVLQGNTDRVFPAADMRPAPIVRQRLAPPPTSSLLNYPDPLPIMAAASTSTAAPLASPDDIALEPYMQPRIEPSEDSGDDDFGFDMAPPPVAEENLAESPAEEELAAADFARDEVAAEEMAADEMTADEEDFSPNRETVVFGAHSSAGLDAAEFAAEELDAEELAALEPEAAAEPVFDESELPPELEVIAGGDELDIGAAIDSDEEIELEAITTDGDDDFSLAPPEEIPPEIAEAQQEPKQDLSTWNFLNTDDKK
jgi:glucuronate isomerase